MTLLKMLLAPEAVGLLRVTENRLYDPSGIQQAITVAGRSANLIVDKTHIGPFAVLYADFTEPRYSGGRHTGYLITLLDHATRVIVGWAVGNRKTTEVALQTLGADEANACHVLRSRPSASTLRGHRVRPSGTNIGSLHVLES